MRSSLWMLEKVEPKVTVVIFNATVCMFLLERWKIKPAAKWKQKRKNSGKDNTIDNDCDDILKNTIIYSGEALIQNLP